MCTVTILYKGNNDFVLTSNRDEAPNRKALPPDFYTINNTKMLFPKDPISNGTWIGVSEKERLICLLNGGFSIHKRQNKYRLSRGVVVKDLLASENIESAINDYNLNNIEPFTLVILDWSLGMQFYELVWDGEQKHFSKLPLDTHIWSSSTLYTNDMKEERRTWFSNFKKDQQLSAENLMQFHKTAGDDNLDYGVVMDRGFVKTTSITQIEKTKGELKMSYEEISSSKIESKTFNFSETVNE